MKPTREQAEEAVKTLLLWAGEDPNRDGLKDTPKRVVKAYEEFFSGYQQCEKQILSSVFEDSHGYTEPVLVRDIEFYSHCEHHMVPIKGVVHISYIPHLKLLGLSKLARLVDVYARRLQTQENLTMDIAKAIMDNLSTKGVAVLVEADHMCMSMRGIKKQKANTITSCFKGVYETDKKLKDDFLKLIRI